MKTFVTDADSVLMFVLTVQSLMLTKISADQTEQQLQDTFLRLIQQCVRVVVHVQLPVLQVPWTCTDSLTARFWQRLMQYYE